VKLTAPAGAPVVVTVTEQLSASKNNVGDTFTGVLAQSVKTADGTVHTFKMADHATRDAGKDVGKATEKSAKVTVYYTEEAGKKVAHFFENH